MPSSDHGPRLGATCTPLAVVLCTATAAAGVAGCGAGVRPPSARPSRPPAQAGRAAAEPAVAPVPSAAPAGRSVSVGPGPEGIVVDARTGLVAVGTRNPAQLVLLDARTGAITRRKPLSGPPRHLQLAAAGGPVLVPEEPVDTLLELSLSGGGSSSIAVGAHPHDATQAGGRLFVGNEFGRSVAVIDGARVTHTIGGFQQPGGVVGAGRELAVIDVLGNTVTVIDARTLRRLGSLPAGEGPTHAVADGAGRLYVIDTRGEAILTFATRPRLSLLHRFRLPGAPYGVAIDPLRHRVWVTLTATDQLVELDARRSSLRRVDVYGTARQPNTVAVDPRDGRVFVADGGPGTVQLIDPRR